MELVQRFGTTPDLFYVVNNGVLAVWPTRDGKLKSLVKTTKDDTERCWIFANCESHTDSDGDEIINHHRRGVVCGSWGDGQNFIRKCTDEYNLSAKSNGYSGKGAGFVPLSNGERFVGRLRPLEDLDRSRYANDWDPAELKRIRIDLPTHIEILVALGRTP